MALPDIHSILKTYWGYSSFRPLQEEVIASVLRGNDTLALMPTGGGKSLCYQVPALASEGLCLVISPLIALMKDQVENIRKKNITAFAVYSGMDRREVHNIFKIAGNSNCKFLYVSPERLETNLFKEYLPSLGVSLIAVDEAHCISQWGYDFRPPYLRIAAIREELPGVPVLALTASATPRVQEDICEKLHFTGAAVFKQSFERPNLSYSVFTPESKINKIIEILGKVPGSSIVYCKSRKRTQQISELIRMHGISSDYYHAGLMQDERNRKQELWLENKVRTIVCTNAFGMGIDKPDVRVVIHADVPECLENYYQEAGRAGRDGHRSYAVLLTSPAEPIELEALPDQRFPPMEEIRRVYQALMNFLQVPANSGEGTSFDFDIAAFLKTFALDGRLTVSALNALEQEGMLTFNEQVFLPARVQFVSTKNTLYNFEKEHPAAEPLIKAMLRSYEGIFDYPVPIHEKSLACTTKQDAGMVRTLLEFLDRYEIIRYYPQKDKPQVYFHRDRAAAEFLQINQVDYLSRKTVFSKRIAEFLKYIGEKTNCRSVAIAAYFGDASVPRCGICDNCMEQRRQSLSQEEFQLINDRIRGALSANGLPAEELFRQLPGIRKEKAWQVIDFLQAENKIAVDANGHVRLA